MSSHDIFVLILISVLIVFLPSPGLFKMFEKARIPAWKAFIPFLNTWEMHKATGLKKHWFYWQFIPVAGWFISLWFFIEFVKLFDKFKLYQHALTVFVPFLYFPYIGFNKKDKFHGRTIVKKHKKSAAREWIDAAVFAIVAATLIRTFIFEAYTIPTGSMEKTLLVNDFLFVSKLSYGPRIPNTPLAVPFVHHTIPVFNTTSYSELIKIPYTRWFASPVKRNDVVVFNFPAGDTVINKEHYQSEKPYYYVSRFELGGGNLDVGRQMILTNPEEYPLVVRPVDKRENYIKRCVAIAGDSLQIRNGVVFVNGQASPFPPKSEMWYEVETNGQILDEETMLEEYDLNLGGDKPGSVELQRSNSPNKFLMLLTSAAKEKMMKNGFAKSMVLSAERERTHFPYDTIHNWTVNDYGPIWVPKKGATLTITPENYSLYERVIRVYEGNALEMRDGKYFINNSQTNQYTFRMNYYWMMGDNRHGSQDSRFWGFVPEDHVVGEAWLIWMSWDGGVRWKRLFRTIH